MCIFLFNKENRAWHTIYKLIGISLKIKQKPLHKNTLNLIFDSETGIGNRIFGLVNYINYVCPKTVNIYWDSKGWVNSRFYDLFVPQFDFVINEYNDIKDTKNWRNTEDEITILTPPCDLRTKNGEKICLLYNKTSNEHINEFRKYFEKLPLSENIIQNFDFLKNISYTAVQIRNNDDWAKYGRNENLEKFFTEMNKMPNNTRFYVSTMQEDILNTVKEKFGDRVLSLPNKDYSSMIDAMSDLYIMSKAHNAIYSYGSTFSELAWWYSGGKQLVTIVGDDTKWE